MLTPNDLRLIGELIDQKLEEKLDNKLKPIKKNIRKIQKDINIIITSFDKDYIDLKGRVDKIERHLKLN